MITVSADTLPSTFAIDSVQVCRSVIEPDDFLLVALYNIHYDSGQPTQTVDKTYHFRLLSTDGEALIGTVQPYAYQNSGYDKGIVGFYFPAAMAPDWGEAYILQINGSPSYFETPPIENYSLADSDYSEYIDQPGNRQLLANYIILTARQLEIDWGVEMSIETIGGIYLTSTGESYFTKAIPGIKIMAPSIFQTASNSPDYSGNEWGTDKADEYKARFLGTWVQESLDDMGGLSGVPAQIATSMVTLVIIVIIFILAQRYLYTTSPAVIASTPVLLCSFILGLVSPSIMAITIFIAILFIGYIFVFRSS